jgi:hypothetical protein
VVAAVTPVAVAPVALLLLLLLLLPLPLPLVVVVVVVVVVVLLLLLLLLLHQQQQQLLLSPLSPPPPRLPRRSPQSPTLPPLPVSAEPLNSSAAAAAPVAIRPESARECPALVSSWLRIFCTRQLRSPAHALSCVGLRRAGKLPPPPPEKRSQLGTFCV